MSRPLKAGVALLCIALLAAALASLRGGAESPGETEVQLSYIGPGAGFAFLGSFLTFVYGLLLGFGSILMLPLRMIWRVLRRRQGFSNAGVRRVIFLGLDGLDPRLTEKYLADGKLPNLARLRDQGSYRRLRTTCPALSPVAWSTFATGVNPGRHNIFDFLNRSTKSYIPELSSARVRPPHRMLRIGRWRIPLAAPDVELRRKSKTFWQLLGDEHIASTIIRVPITFPPEKFNGRLLSAMSTPDLRGTQGSFSYFSTRVETATYENGSRYPLIREGGALAGRLEGPEDPLRVLGLPLEIPFRIVPDGESARLEIGSDRINLKLHDYTPWINLKFSAAPGFDVHGIARFMLTESGPEFSLYATPVQIDPERPALPISHPPFYSAYLAKLLGTYSTLGMAEDTWALNEGVIDEQAFLDQAYEILAEREAMFRNALEKTPRGVVACVFDTSDRVQHMFFRQMDGDGRFAQTIEDLYRRMDGLAGLALSHLDRDSVLFVLSDHGFCAFERSVNLNNWLRDQGYLVTNEGVTEIGPYFKGVDWKRTRAYAVGLSGLYLNLAGRELYGTVKPGGEASALRVEIASKLAGLRDESKGCDCIRAVHDSASIYKGPYAPDAPDLIIGYSEGYRTSWDAAIGKTSQQVIEDNPKAWSGDHAVDPDVVPGVLFCSRKVEAPNPGIEDLAPTALSLFGLAAPRWMDGKCLFHHES